mgnify:CR=1 FL=1
MYAQGDSYIQQERAEQVIASSFVGLLSFELYGPADLPGNALRRQAEGRQHVLGLAGAAELVVYPVGRGRGHPPVY